MKQVSVRVVQFDDFESRGDGSSRGDNKGILTGAIPASSRAIRRGIRFADEIALGATTGYAPSSGFTMRALRPRRLAAPFASGVGELYAWTEPMR